MANAARRRFVKALLLSAAGLALSGCGQKGPLYLPEETEDEKKKQKTSSREPRTLARV